MREDRVRRQGRQRQDHAVVAVRPAPGRRGRAGGGHRRRHQPAPRRRAGPRRGRGRGAPGDGRAPAPRSRTTCAATTRASPSAASMVKTTPPGRGSRLLRVGGDDPIHARCAASTLGGVAADGHRAVHRRRSRRRLLPLQGRRGRAATSTTSSTARASTSWWT